jgi:cytochrome c biogenesis protein CcdA
LNETLLWLVYLVSGGLAFAATYYWRWSVALAVLAGVLVTTIGWLMLFRFTDEEKRPDWIRLDLSLNLSFGLIFAGIGAALGWWLLTSRNRVD